MCKTDEGISFNGRKLHAESSSYMITFSEPEQTALIKENQKIYVEFMDREFVAYLIKHVLAPLDQFCLRSQFIGFDPFPQRHRQIWREALCRQRVFCRLPEKCQKISLFHAVFLTRIILRARAALSSKRWQALASEFTFRLSSLSKTPNQIRHFSSDFWLDSYFVAWIEATPVGR